MIDRAKLITFALVFTVAVLAGCVYHNVSAREMIADMHKIQAGKNAIINILWYEGSDSEFDYFSYVYSMTGTKNFKVPIGELALERMKRTDNETAWVAIREIDGVWSASRLRLSRLSKGIWEPDTEGVSVRLADKHE